MFRITKGQNFSEWDKPRNDCQLTFDDLGDALIAFGSILKNDPVFPLTLSEDNHLSDYVDIILIELWDRADGLMMDFENNSSMLVQTTADHVLNVLSDKFGDRLDTLTINVHFFGKLETVTGKRGNYPYDCTSKDKRPDDFIFYFRDGSWVPFHSLSKLETGNYLLKL